MGKKGTLVLDFIIQKMETKDGLAALFEFATEGILVADSNGIIVKVNPAANRLFGYDKDELVGVKVEQLVPNRYADHHHEKRDKFNHSPHPRSMGRGMDLFAKKKDGSELPVEISLSPYANEDGKFTIAFIVDISERKEAEKKLKNYSGELEKEVEQRTLILSEAISELEKTKEDLNDALAKEKELNDLKTRFVSMVSHEFRTPLATILSSLALVKRYVENNDTEKQAKHIDRIKTSVSNLTDILNDVLSLSKLEDGKVIVHWEDLDIKQFMDEVLQDFQDLTKVGQELEYFHTGTSNNVLIDQKILRHIVFNLISNAIKFSPENEQIIISTEVTKNSFLLEVKDSGIGISEEDQKHLFESFFRGENAANIQGTGLGLNIVARYVDLLKGKIELQSSLGKGTTFKIIIPQ